MIFSTRIITILLIVQAVAFAASCAPGFRDVITVRVFNEDYVLIQDATVNVHYQLDSTTAKGYFNTTKSTDENGTARFVIQNLEVLPGSVDCDVDITVRFDNEERGATITATAHSTPVDVFIRAYPLTLQVVDQNNRPIEGAQLFIQNRTAVTDKNGRANFLVGKGRVRILAKYDIGKVEQEVDVVKPLFHIIGFGFYPLRIKVIDDDGNPLAATVTVGEQNYDAPQGVVEVLKIAKAKPSVKVYYRNVERRVDVDLAVQSDYTAVFDFTPPQLKDIRVLPSSVPNRIKLGITLVDEGRFASGIKSEGISMAYKYDAGTWQTAKAYSVALNQYGVDLPRPAGAQLLLFTIDTADKEGNRASFDGQWTLQNGSTPSVSNGTDNRSAGRTPPPPPAQDIPWPAVAGIGVVGIIIYLVYRFKLSQGGGSG